MAAVNLKRVAHEAGVSLATASRVLSGSDYPVAPELRERVIEVANKLDYVPNTAARGLLSGTSKTAGVLVGDVSDPYFSAMIGGMHRVAADLGYMVTIANTYRDADAELLALKKLHGQRVDVLVVAGSGLHDERYTRGLEQRLTSFIATGKSAVLVGKHHAKPDGNVTHILMDDHGGARLLAEYLRDLGHREVALLAGDKRLWSTTDRVCGFREVFGEHLTVVPVEPTRDGGREGALALMAGMTRVTAIAATADQMALGALVALRELGVQVPTEMSVAGFNDIEVAKDLVPSLTTVQMPLVEAGAAAMEQGIARLHGEAIDVALPARLEVRGSTAPPRPS